MTRIVGALLRQFGPTSGTPTTPPASPTLALVDKADGSGAVATISGSTPGATNTVYTASWGGVGTLTWTARGSRAGNGTVDLSLPPGIYLAYVVSVLDGQAVSPVTGVRTTASPAEPTGSLALPLAGIEELLSRSATFQAAAGKDAAGLKRDHIYFGRRELPADAEYGETLVSQNAPYVVVHASMHSYLQVGQGVEYTLANDGGMVVEFIMAARSDESYKQGYLRFTDYMSAVVDEISELVGRDTLWPFNKFEMLEEPFRPNIVDRHGDDFWLGTYLFRYEVEQ